MAIRPGSLCSLVVAAILAAMFSAMLVDAWDLSQDRGSTRAEKQMWIDLHNYYRARVARGEESGQPPAADMIAMEWDERLVESAQKWSDTCQGWHNSVEDRRFKPYPNTGQNYAGLHGLTESVRVWYDEVTEGNFRFSDFGCSQICGHYTQVVWSASHLLGCTQNKCRSYGDDKTNTYCEYAPGGNTMLKSEKDPVYISGKACSMCPEGFGFCMEGALCASHRACDKSDSKCICTITTCANKGEFDKETCSCTCPSGFQGLRCEAKCEDTITYCDGYKDSQCMWDAQMWMWIGRVCRKTCGTCGKRKDDGMTNPDGIKTNVKDLTSEIGCKNKAGDASCELWQDKCKTGDNMKEDCQRTCGFCKSFQGGASGNGGNTEGTGNGGNAGGNGNGGNTEGTGNGGNTGGNENGGNTGDARCRNDYNDNQCKEWAANDQCKRNQQWMYVNCAQSCGCPDSGDGGGSTGAKTCSNKHDNKQCESWRASGQCSGNPGWMHLNCAKSCGCPGANKKNKINGGSNCRDLHNTRDCTTWAGVGECSRNPDWMLKNCQKSCNSCNK